MEANDFHLGELGGLARQRRRHSTEIIGVTKWGRQGYISDELKCDTREDSEWGGCTRCFQLVVDNKILMEQQCGNVKCMQDDKASVEYVANCIANLIIIHKWNVRTVHADPIMWRKRNLNKEADYLANLAMDSEQARRYVCGCIWELQKGTNQAKPYNIIV